MDINNLNNEYKKYKDKIYPYLHKALKESFEVPQNIDSAAKVYSYLIFNISRFSLKSTIKIATIISSNYNLIEKDLSEEEENQLIEFFKVDFLNTYEEN